MSASQTDLAATGGTGSSDSGSETQIVTADGTTRAGEPVLIAGSPGGTAGTLIPLRISAAAAAADPTEAVTITIAGVPSTARLSAGTLNPDGTWTLTLTQTDDLTMRTSALPQTANLTVTATGIDNGDPATTTSQSKVITVQANLAAPAPGAMTDLSAETTTDNPASARVVALGSQYADLFVEPQDGAPNLDWLRIFDPATGTHTPLILVTSTDANASTNNGDAVGQIQATALSDGRLLVIWLDTDGTVKGTIYDAAGAVSAANLVLASPSDTVQSLSYPRVALTANGGFTLLYIGNDGSPTGTPTLNTYDSSGALLGSTVFTPPAAANSTQGLASATLTDGSPVGIAIFTQDAANVPPDTVAAGYVIALLHGNTLSTIRSIYAGALGNPQIVALSNGGYAFTVEYPNSANLRTILGASFDASGTEHDFTIQTEVGDGTTVTPTPTVALTALPGGGFLVTYDQTATAGGGDTRYAQQFNDLGQKLGGPIQITTGVGDSSLATLSDGSVVSASVLAADGNFYAQTLTPLPATTPPTPAATTVGLPFELSPNAPFTLAALSTGGFVEGYETAGGMEFRLFDANANEIGGPTAYTTINNYNIGDPIVAALTGGRFLAIWQIADGAHTEYDAAIYDNAGNQVVAPFRLTPAVRSIPEFDLYPRIAALTNGGFQVTWESTVSIDQYGTDYVNTPWWYSQTYAASGAPVGSATGIDGYYTHEVTIGGSANGPVVASIEGSASNNNGQTMDLVVNGKTLIASDINTVYLEDLGVTQLDGGGYVVSFYEQTAGAARSINGFVFSAAGAETSSFSVPTNFNLTGAGTDWGFPPNVVALTGGGFAVTVNNLSPNVNALEGDIQVFDQYGTPVNGQQTVLPGAYYSQGVNLGGGNLLYAAGISGPTMGQILHVDAYSTGPRPSGVNFQINATNAKSAQVAGLPDGGFVAVYQATNLVGGVYGRVYDASGTPKGPEFQISAQGTAPVVASAPDGNILVAWADVPPTDFHLATLNPDGTVSFGPFDLMGPVDGTTVGRPTVAYNGSGFSVSYDTQDQTGATTSYVAKLTEDGNITEGPTAIPATGGAMSTLDPASSKTSVKAEIGDTSGVSDDFTALLGSVNQFAGALGGGTPPLTAQAGIQLLGSFFGSLLSSQLASGQASVATGQDVVRTTAASGPTVVNLTPLNDGVIRSAPAIAELAGGDAAVTWAQYAPGASTWTVVTQLVAPDGTLVGSALSIATDMRTTATPDLPTVLALGDGGFLVSYDTGDGYLAAQRYSESGAPIGGMFQVSGTGQSTPVATVLANGSLLAVSTSTSGVVSGMTFSVAAQGIAWNGSTGSNLGAAVNWTPAQLPDATDAVSFSLTTGGMLTGTLAALSASFSGASTWIAQNATLTLSGDTSAVGGPLGVSDQGSLALNGSTIAAGGAVDIEAAAGAVATVSGLSSLSDTVTTIGGQTGNTGTLVVTGAGTSVTGTGASTIGGSGTGHLAVQSGATATVAGLEIAQAAGSRGDAVVTGASSLLSSTGQFVVGDGGLGDLSIESGATVSTNPGAVAAIVGQAASADGSFVEVVGSDSTWRVGGTLNVGVLASADLNVSDGGTVTVAALDAGVEASGVGQVSVTGAQSRLTVTGDATIADDGTGVLTVLNGATFAATDLTIGSQGDSSGALVVSGSGSVVQLSGNLNVGTSQGTGDLTVGPGAAVHASVVSLQGQVVLEGGLLDPTVNVINQGQTAGGFGTLAAGFIVDEGLIQAGGSKPAQKLLLVQGTIVGGGTLFKNNAAQPSATGVIQINAGGTVELTGAVVNAPTTTFTDNLTPTGTYTVTNSVVDVSFADAAGVLLLDDIAQFGGTIASFQNGDKFVITGGTLSNVGVSNGNTLTFSDSGTGAATGGADSIIFGSAVNAGHFNIVNNNTVQVVPCFAAGTRIETARGMIRVEELSVGDRAITADGRREPIVWIGQRRVDCTRHPSPETVWPVRVAVGALGRNVPARDVYLSPDHAVFVNDVLVPVKLLINGTSIVQVERATVTYYHVELARHEVVLAEGMAVESYLDLGDRANFRDAGGTIRLFPDFAARLAPGTARVWETRGAATLVVAGDRLEAVRRTIVAGNRATDPGAAAAGF